MKANCGFGIFPELSRAWLSVDTVLYLWNFETNTDIAYCEMQHTILRVNIVNVKPAVFEVCEHSIFAHQIAHLAGCKISSCCRDGGRRYAFARLFYG